MLEIMIQCSNARLKLVGSPLLQVDMYICTVRSLCSGRHANLKSLGLSYSQLMYAHTVCWASDFRSDHVKAELF
jgi:hypothetical protein